MLPALRYRTLVIAVIFRMIKTIGKLFMNSVLPSSSFAYFKVFQYIDLYRFNENVGEHQHATDKSQTTNQIHNKVIEIDTTNVFLI